MLTNLRAGVTAQLMRVQLVQGDPQDTIEEPQMPEMTAHHVDPLTGEDEMADGYGSATASTSKAAAATAGTVDDKKNWGKVGRNETCPCGSGLKYKHCHGKLT